MKLNSEDLENKLVKAIEKTVTTLPKNTIEAIEEAKLREKDGAKSQINNMLKSIDISENKKVPICQDTGTPTFFVLIGSNFGELNKIGEIKTRIKKSVKRATKEVPLRPNSVHPLTDKNTGNNIGVNIPYIHWRVVEGNDIKIKFLPKGGGSENMSQLYMLNPSKGIKEVKKTILERIASMGGKPCPPTVVGVGLGGGSDIAMSLAKESLLRPVGVKHEESEIRKLEEELKKKANELGVGPMGIGGETTVLDVKIEYANRHPASFPLGIVIQCWCNRRGAVNIKQNGEVVIKN